MRSIRKIILSVLLSLSVSGLYASSGFSVGIEGGYSLGIISTETVWDNTYNRPFHGFDATIAAEFRFTDKLAIDTGVRYIMKSSKYVHRYISDGTVSTTDNYAKMHHYIQLPLTLRFYVDIGHSLNVFLGGGGFVGYKLFEMHAGYFSTVYNGSQYYAKLLELNSGDNRLDAGLIAEAGLSYDMSDTYLNVTLRYQYGLTSLAKGQESGVNTYFDNLSLNAGILCRL